MTIIIRNEGSTVYSKRIFHIRCSRALCVDFLLPDFTETNRYEK